MEFYLTGFFVYLVLHDCAARCSLNIPHGKVRPWCVRSRNTLCSFVCDEGYEPTNIIATCSSQGIWQTSAGPPCVGKPCSSVIPNGRLADYCFSRVGSSCGYSCNAGYQKKAGIHNITCEPSTNWSSNLHSLCTNEEQCPYEVANGDLDLSCKRSYGETCGYSCHEGYHPSGASEEITCGYQGSQTWSHPLSTICKKILCPSEIPHGEVSSRCTRGYNELCTRFRCKTGYAQSVSGFTIWCNASGLWQWNENRGQPCAKTTEICPIYIENGGVNSWCSRQPGASCSYYCDMGCTKDHGIEHLICENNGHWNYEDHLCYNCGPKTTTARPPSNCPSVIRDGYISTSCPRYPNSVCDYYCNADCQPYFRSQKLYCTTNSYWEHGTDACSCQGSEARSISDGDDSASPGVIIGIVVSLVVVGFLLFAFVWICYKRQWKQRSHNQPHNEDFALQGTGTNGISYRVSLPEYLPANRTNSHSSLQHLNRTEQNTDMQPAENSNVHPQEPSVGYAHIIEPPAYNTLVPNGPEEDPPSYDQVIRHPTRFNATEEESGPL